MDDLSMIERLTRIAPQRIADQPVAPARRAIYETRLHDGQNFTHATGLEVVEVRKEYSVGEGGGFSIFIHSIGRERDVPASSLDFNCRGHEVGDRVVSELPGELNFLASQPASLLDKPASSSDEHCGFENPVGANHCFLNSCLQALWHSPAFREAILAFDANEVEHPLIVALQSLFANVKYGNGEALSPNVVRETVESIDRANSLFGPGYTTADVAECFDLLLQCVHKDAGSEDGVQCTCPACGVFKSFSYASGSNRFENLIFPVSCRTV
jgi:hypothetical protein